jgi:hypothetical protein
MPDPVPASDPLDDYLVALRTASNLYEDDNITSRFAAVHATITYLEAITDNNDGALTTPLKDVLSRLADESEDLARVNDVDEDGNRRGRGNAKPVKASLDDAIVSAVITLARQTGRTLKEAATIVADQTGSKSHQPEEIQRLITSRRNLMDGKASPDAVNHYHVLIAAAAKAHADGRSPEEILSEAVIHARRMITGRTSASKA